MGVPPRLSTAASRGCPSTGPTNVLDPPRSFLDLGETAIETAVTPAPTRTNEDDRVPAAPAATSQETMTERPDMAPAKAPLRFSGTEMAPTLRANPQPTLVKIRSVRVEVSPMFAHLYEDGSVFFNDYEDDDD